jgi:glycosyltransferase involved in cell wall biosynthesis
VLPVYNGESYLDLAIHSILSQRDHDLELIISDDCSSDGTVDLVRSFSDPRIRLLVNSTRLGIFGNLNRAIGVSRGGFIQVFSQDDIMLPGYLSAQRSMFAEDERIGLVYGRPRYIDAVGRDLPAMADDTPSIIGFETYLWISSHYGALPASISSIMVRREVFDVVGMFDASYRVAGDVEFYNRVAERYLLGYEKSVRHCIRGHARAMSAVSSSGPLYLEEERRLQAWYQKYWTDTEFLSIRAFRCSTRARFHVGWIRGLVAQGRFREAVVAAIRLNSVYPLHEVAWAYFGRLLGFKYIDKPRLGLVAPNRRISAGL